MIIELSNSDIYSILISYRTLHYDVDLGTRNTYTSNGILTDCIAKGSGKYFGLAVNLEAKQHEKHDLLNRKHK